MDWFDLVPHGVAVRQVAWERAKRVKWARRHAKASLRDIAARLDRSVETVRHDEYKADHRNQIKAPVTKWLESGGEIAEFIWRVQEQKRQRNEALAVLARYYKCRARG